MRLVYPTFYELWDIQDRMRIYRRPVITNFEVQVRPGRGATGHADIPNYISLAHALSAAYRGCVHHVGVERLPAIAMVNDDQVTIAPGIPPGINYHTCIGGIDRIA